MPAVAHEGNPVENTLVVSGTLDSTPPALEPTIPVGGGAAPIETFLISASSNWDCIHGVTDITITVSGGTPPYDVETSLGNIAFVSTGIYLLTPPTNSGSGVSGEAYAVESPYCGPSCVINCVNQTYGCADQVHSACGDGGAGCGFCNTQGQTHAVFCDPAQCHFCDSPAIDCDYARSAPTCDLGGYGCDTRSGDMISGGCNPCGISTIPGAVVTATDATGKQVFTAVVNSLVTFP